MLGFFSNCKAVRRAEEDSRRRLAPGRTSECVHKDMDYEQALAEARNIGELKERVEVIITSTMMLVLSMPHVPHVQIKEIELREPFEHLFGDERDTLSQRVSSPRSCSTRCLALCQNTK